jgi:tetratricopeptide (TPR) repeat protein
MSVKKITFKAKRLLSELLLALFVLLPTTAGYAEEVKIHSAVKGNRLQIILDWPQAVSFKTMVDETEAPSGTEGHELLLRFDQAIETSDLEILDKKTYDWLTTIRTGYDTFLLQSRNKVTYKVLAEGKRIRIEIARHLSSPAGPTLESSTENDLLITFAQKVLEDNRPELMNRIFEKHGDGFLSTRPLLAAQLMLALKDKSSSLSWVKKAENQPNMTLDQQIELVGLYEKLGQSDKIGQTKNTRNLDHRIALELNDSKLSQSRIEGLIYVMLELEAHEQVLPHLKQLAYHQGGNWVYPYEETLAKLGKNEELIEFLRVHVKRSGLDVEEKRRIAFSFLNVKSKADALPVFRVLADTAPAKSPDVAQLMFLWGPRPADRDRKWLVDKAKASKNEERTEWLWHLVNAGGAREAVLLALREPSSNVTDNLFKVYVQILQELEDKQVFASTLEKWLESETNPDRLIRYGSLAEGRSQLQLANRAYKKVLEVRPGDKLALKQLGWNSFYLSQWNDTQKFLGQILTQKDPDGITKYYYAEAMYLEGHISESLPFFQQALDIVSKKPSLDTKMEIIKAALLNRLDRKKEALVIYERLLKVSPADKKLRVKYISCLMDVGDFEQAQKWLTLSKN